MPPSPNSRRAAEALIISTMPYLHSVVLYTCTVSILRKYNARLSYFRKYESEKYFRTFVRKFVYKITWEKGPRGGYVYCTLLLKKILSSSFFGSIQLISLFAANTHTIQPSYCVPYSLVSNFSRLKGVPAGVRALLESRERHERRRRPQRIYSKHHDASTHAKILHRSL